MNIGFIGIGVMGKSIAEHLITAGHQLTIHTRTKEKAETLLEKGAEWKNSPAELAKNSDLLFTMVSYPKDVEKVYFSKEGIFEGLAADKVLVDMTTSTPLLAERIAKRAEKIGAYALDAPVSGGDLGAQEGRLTVMVGGEKLAFEIVRPIMEIFSKELRLFGPAGSGQHTKMANQIMLAGTMTAMTEMFVYAEKAGLNLEKVVKTVNGGGAQNRSIELYAQRMIQEDYSPGFFVKHFVKDLKIALDEAEVMGLELPATEKAYDLYKMLEDEGYGDEGTQALIKLWFDGQNK